jgi:DNA-directed RNA polymerase specialized sigma24 family protein
MFYKTSIGVFNEPVELEEDWRDALRALVNDSATPASVATRARIVLWWAEGRTKKEIAALAGVSRPTVDLWLALGCPVDLGPRPLDMV